MFKEDLDEKYHYSKYFHQLMNEVDYLNRILKIDPILTYVYQEIKRYYYFNHYWNDYSRDEALDYISKFINDCFSSNITELINIASSLNNWKQYIVNSFITYTKHNGEVQNYPMVRLKVKLTYQKDA